MGEALQLGEQGAQFCLQCRILDEQNLGLDS